MSTTMIEQAAKIVKTFTAKYENGRPRFQRRPPTEHSQSISTIRQTGVIVKTVMLRTLASLLLNFVRAFRVFRGPLSDQKYPMIFPKGVSGQKVSHEFPYESFPVKSII